MFPSHLFSAPRRAVTLVLSLVLALVALLGGWGVRPADAAVPPPVVQPNSSSGVSTDVLPTTQVNPGGWVWDQAIVGDTVYAGGSFSSARPAGAAAGTSESTRGNMLAYSISTGNLVAGFAPKFNNTVRVLALSPDKSRLYVGGDFTTVDGATHNHLVAFKASGGSFVVDPTFTTNVGGPVYALSVSGNGSTVYLGGQFTSVNGNTRGRLAAVTSSGGLVSAWIPKANGAPTSVPRIVRGVDAGRWTKTERARAAPTEPAHASSNTTPGLSAAFATGGPRVALPPTSIALDVRATVLDTRPVATVPSDRTAPVPPNGATASATSAPSAPSS